MSNESKILPSVSTAGLEALANSMLAPRSQSRLDELLRRNSEGELSKVEIEELDSLLEQVDEQRCELVLLLPGHCGPVLSA